MKKLQFRAICKEHNIRPGTAASKEQIVERVFICSQTMNAKQQLLNNLLQVLKKPALKDPASLHAFYWTNFNLDDLTDRKWYAVEECHSNHYWQSKFTLGILCFAVYDAWIYFTKANYASWKDWCMDLATKLYHFVLE